MGPFSIVLLALHLFYTTTLSELLDAPRHAANSISDTSNDYSLLLPSENYEVPDDEDVFADIAEMPDGDLPMIQTFEDKTEVKFRHPIKSVNIDYSRNAVVLKFHKNNAKSVMKLDSVENEKKKSVQDNFIRFGKRSYEEFPLANSMDEGFIDKNHGMRLERSHQTARDARGDNFMRFGRAASQDFMRFGRTPNQDFMRFGRTPKQDFMRFGRTPSQDFMRFGRTPNQDFMRFGRAPMQDFMRFGRTPRQDFMRFGRQPNQDFMRFGRTPKEDFMRYSRPDNFMRFGRAPPQVADNFMRFGKSTENSNDKNASQTLMDKSELKQAVKLIHDADKNADNENPVDKAIKVLFDKHRKLDVNGKARSDGESSSQHNDGGNDVDSDTDYFFKMLK